MDALPSTEFRKRFARLTEPTLVTVNGHEIGMWIPNKPEAYRQALEDGRPASRFSSRPFTPVPKTKR